MLACASRQSNEVTKLMRCGVYIKVGANTAGSNCLCAAPRVNAPKYSLKLSLKRRARNKTKRRDLSRGRVLD